MSVLETGRTPAIAVVPVEATRSTYGLRFRCLSPLEVLAQSVANIAPSACMAAVIPAVHGSAAGGTWLAFVVATVGLTLVSLNINQFSRKSASPGSLYAYTTMGLGPTAGVLCGWGLMAAYLATAVALGGAATDFALALCGSPTGVAWRFVAFASIAAITWFVAFKDIRLSARLMLGLEFVSVGFILLLGAVVFSKFGFHIHLPQLRLEGTTPSGFFLGLVLAVFCYVGFESSTTLGEEARNPLRTIPRAVIGSVVIVGMSYMFMTFAEVGAFAHAGKDLNDKTSAGDVLQTLADQTGMGFMGPVLVTMALVSSLGCVLASLNAGSRVLFSMARHGVFHEAVGGAHQTNETPHTAVTCCTIVLVAVAGAMMVWGYMPIDLVTLGGTFATFGFFLAYIFISLAAPMYLRRQGRVGPGVVSVSLLAMLFMIVPVIGSFWPVPEQWSQFVLPYLFFGYMAIGLAWLIIRRQRSRQMINKIEKDLEEIGERFNLGKSMFAADKEVVPGEDQSGRE